jgi:hypothetical protein
MRIQRLLGKMMALQHLLEEKLPQRRSKLDLLNNFSAIREDVVTLVAMQI